MLRIHRRGFLRGTTPLIKDWFLLMRPYKNLRFRTELGFLGGGRLTSHKDWLPWFMFFGDFNNSFL